MLNNPFQKLEVNFVSLSDIIAFGIPLRQIMLSMNNLATCCVLYWDFVGIKCAILLNLSTMIIKLSYLVKVVSGNCTIKSIVMTSQGLVGMSIGAKRPPSLIFLVFVCWQVSHVVTNSLTSCCMPRQ